MYMFSHVPFSKAYEPNKHNALSLARAFESKPTSICEQRQNQELLEMISSEVFEHKQNYNGSNCCPFATNKILASLDLSVGFAFLLPN